MDLLEIAKIIELGESAAFQDMFRAAPPEFAANLGMETKQFGSATAIKMAKVPQILFNRVIGLGLNEPATEKVLDTIVEFYAKDGVSFAVQPAPGAQPAQLADWLESRGCKRRDNWAKVYRRGDKPPVIETRLRVTEIGPAQAAEFIPVNLEAHKMPGPFSIWLTALIGRPNWHFYLAYDGETPVSCGTLYVNNGIGWLGLGGTLPSHRRLGGQGAVMAERIVEATRQGCQWLITETGEDVPENPNPSYRNMLRTGFELAYQRPNYIYKPL